MLNDPIQRWEPFPSRMDGIRRPPHAWVAGWRVDLFAYVEAGDRHFGVRFPSTRAWSGIEEYAYSVGTSDDDGGSYDGGVYLKKARASAFLASAQAVEWIVEEPLKAFLLVGSDCCYEVVCVGDPEIIELPSFEEAEAWAIKHASGAKENV